MSEHLTFQQARARIARTLLAHYSRDEIAQKLALVDCNRLIGPFDSAVSLAYKLAWTLLPASSRLERPNDRSVVASVCPTTAIGTRSRANDAT